MKKKARVSVSLIQNSIVKFKKAYGMARVGAQRAAELTGKSKSTIQRAMNSGKISYEIDNNGRRVIDVAELDRAFGVKLNTDNTQTTSQLVAHDSQAIDSIKAELEIEKATIMLEAERLKMRVKMLEEQLDSARDHNEDLKSQRDKWERQASQMLITSQYTQKQAENREKEVEDLRSTIKERERVARERRQKLMEEKMKSMQADNENEDAGGPKSKKGFLKLWG